MMPLIITDIIFLKDRGKYQTLYFTIYFGSLMVRLAGSSSSNTRLANLNHSSATLYQVPWLKPLAGAASGGSMPAFSSSLA